MKITKEQFESYEEVRVSGVTNMWDVEFVCKVSGLTEEQAMKIMKTYGELAKKFK